jgi:hypothetical protein
VFSIVPLGNRTPLGNDQKKTLPHWIFELCCGRLVSTFSTNGLSFEYLIDQRINLHRLHCPLLLSSLQKLKCRPPKARKSKLFESARYLILVVISTAYFSLPLVLSLPLRVGLSLKVPGVIFATARERPHMVNYIALARSSCRAVGRAGISQHELQLCRLAALHAGVCWRGKHEKGRYHDQTHR